MLDIVALMVALLAHWIVPGPETKTSPGQLDGVRDLVVGSEETRRMEGPERMVGRHQQLAWLGRPYWAIFNKGQLDDMVEDPKETIGLRRSGRVKQEPVRYGSGGA